MVRVSLIILAVLILLLAPIPLPGDDGVYNTTSGLMWCRTAPACIHENGHKLDHTLGWVSDSENFRQALQIYIIAQIRSGKPSELAMWIFDYPGLFRPAPRFGWNAMAEIYAEIYFQAGGDINQIPANFRKYYRIGWREQ